MTHVPGPPSASTIDQHLMFSITIQYHIGIMRQGKMQTRTYLVYLMNLPLPFLSLAIYKTRKPIIIII